MPAPLYSRAQSDRRKQPWPHIEQFLRKTNEIVRVAPPIHVETKVGHVLDDLALTLFIQTIRNQYQSPEIAQINATPELTFRELYLQLSDRVS